MGKRTLLAAAVVAALTSLVFLPSAGYDFINWDDHIYVYQNPSLGPLSLDMLSWAFSANLMGVWNPLVWLSYSLDYTIGGIDPGQYHKTNLILHCFNAFFVALLFFRLLVYAGLDSRAARFGAVCAALFFSIHPMRIESVVWVSERRDLLFMAFYLMATHAYISYVEHPAFRKLKYLMIAALFIFSLMCKPTAVTFPLALLIIDMYPLRRHVGGRGIWALVKEKIPLFLIAASYSVFQLYMASDLIRIDRFSLYERLLLAFRSVAHYALKTVIPTDLSPYYPLPSSISITDTPFALSVLFFFASIAFVLRKTQSRPVLAATWGFFLTSLLPVSGILQQGINSMSDRYTYLPSLGLSMIFGALAARLWSGLRDRPAAVRGITALIVTVPFLSMAWVSSDLMPIWQNSTTFWRYTAEMNPRDKTTLVNLARSYIDGSERGEGIRQLDRAVALFRDDASIYNMRGLAYLEGGDTESARRDFTWAVELARGPGSSGGSREKLAVYLNNLASAYSALGMHQKAERNLSQALGLSPERVHLFYFHRAMARMNLEREEEAVADLRAAAEGGHKDARIMLHNMGIKP